MDEHHNLNDLWMPKPFEVEQIYRATSFGIRDAFISKLKNSNLIEG